MKYGVSIIDIEPIDMYYTDSINEAIQIQVDYLLLIHLYASEYVKRQLASKFIAIRKFYDRIHKSI